MPYIAVQSNKRNSFPVVDPCKISKERAAAWYRNQRALSTGSKIHPLADLHTLHLSNPAKADAAPRTCFSSFPLWKQEALSSVGKGGHSYAELSRELDANGHKYPDITQADLAIAWEHNRGEPASMGAAAEKDCLTDRLYISAIRASLIRMNRAASFGGCRDEPQHHRKRYTVCTHGAYPPPPL